MTDNKTIYKRLGMLIGLHVGDCLGIPLEFGPPRKLGYWLTDIYGGGTFDFPPGVGSDDTDLMLCLLRSISENKGFALHDIAKKLVEWKHTNPPDIGNTTRMGIRNIEKGERLDRCGSIDESSQGNGSIMRCAPLALLPNITEKEITSQARLTHAHPICIETDICFIRFLQFILNGNDGKKYDIEGFFSAEDVQDYLTKCPDLTWDEIPNTGWCVHSLGIALWALHNYNSFTESIIAVVNRGDDADTGGAVAGALLGAHYGYEAIPQRWVKKLNSAEEIKTLLNTL